MMTGHFTVYENSADDERVVRDGSVAIDTGGPMHHCIIMQHPTPTATHFTLDSLVRMFVVALFSCSEVACTQVFPSLPAWWHCSKK